MSAEVDWERWRADRAASLATDHGWLSLTGFAWLPATPSTVDGLPGLWWSDDALARVTASADDGLVVGGSLVDGTIATEVAEGASLLWVAEGERRVELVRRGGRYAVRTRDPQAATLTGFRGIPAFDHDPGWVRPGRFREYTHPRVVPVTSARDDLKQEATLVGAVEVEIGGERHVLQATQGAGLGLTLAFHDLTNGKETARWRAVGTTVPTPDGSLLVDFNRAVNFPFAFTEFGTCPAPVDGNSLPLAVTAGERRPEIVG